MEIRKKTPRQETIRTISSILAGAQRNACKTGRPLSRRKAGEIISGWTQPNHPIFAAVADAAERSRLGWKRFECDIIRAANEINENGDWAAEIPLEDKKCQ